MSVVFGGECLFFFFCGCSKSFDLSGVEFQKLRINLRNVQEKNLQLAQANSHTLDVCSPSFYCSVLRWLRDYLKYYGQSMASSSFIFPGRSSVQTETGHAFLELKSLKTRLSYFIILQLPWPTDIVCTFSAQAARMYYSNPRKCILRAIVYIKSFLDKFWSLTLCMSFLRIILYAFVTICRDFNTKSMCSYPF